ncbi:MAG: PAS domain-containing protein [Alphaproteobacteria bacterium]|nr:PAS domain-containing protein [Alphaproteobacteria bacterium]MBV8406119.1 PAS domain-containing protein [Alphaproteobacteria bacterium]
MPKSEGVESKRTAWPAAAHLLLFALIIAVPLLLLVGVLLYRASVLEHQQIEQRIVQETGELVGNVERELDRHLAILKALASSSALAAEDWPAFYAQARSSLQGKLYLVLTDSSGRQIVNTYVPYGEAPSRSGDPEILRAVLRSKGPIVSDLFVSQVAKVPVYSVSMPILHGDDVRYVIGLGLRPDTLQELVGSPNLQAQFGATVWDSKGTIVAGSRERRTRVGQPVPIEFREHADHAVFEAIDLDGNLALAATAHLSGAGWGIAVTFPATVVEQQIRNSLWLWGGTAASVGMLVVVLALLFGRQITRPLAAATAAAQALGRGEPFDIEDSHLSEANAVIAALRQARRDLDASTSALRESEEQLRAAAEAAQFGAHQYDVASDRSHRSAQFREIIGVGESSEMATFEAGLGFVHPDDRARIRQRKQEILAKAVGRYELEYRIRRPDGQVRWVMDRGQVMRDPASGKANKVVGVLLDISELKAAEQRQQLLFDELNHRVKNTLSIVQSLAQQTLRTRPDPKEFAGAFEARLQSLARAHDLLTRESWGGASLAEIVSAALAPFLDEGRDIRIGGGDVTIPAATTITLSLMLHELATNAAKYGALSVPAGRLSISWTVEPVHKVAAVDLLWQEEDGPMVSPPKRKGFGSRLLAASSVQLDARFELDYAPSGFRCRLRFTVTSPPAS